MVRPWSLMSTAIRCGRKSDSLAAGRLFAEGQVQSEIKTLFYVRYLAGIDESMRVVCDGENYDIQSVSDPQGNRRELLISTILRR